LLKLEPGYFNSIKIELGDIINNTLGENFTYILLDGIFEANLNYLLINSLYPFYLMIVLIIIGIVAIYNYQKGGIFEKAKDFFIMKALGSKEKSIKRIIFLEGLLVILPSLVISLSIGMILNAIIIFDPVVLPPLYVPFIIITFLGVSAVSLNYISIIPLIKKVKQFSIKNFEIY
jgi:ABC-type antimicrobial peptide transport system permease subunit